MAQPRRPPPRLAACALAGGWNLGAAGATGAAYMGWPCVWLVTAAAISCGVAPVAAVMPASTAAAGVAPDATKVSTIWLWPRPCAAS